MACPKEQENYSNASKKSLISADPQRLGQWGNARNWRKLSWKWKLCCERQLATYHLIPFSFKTILVSMCAVVPSPLCLYTYNGWECDEARCKRVSGEVRIAQCRPLLPFSTWENVIVFVNVFVGVFVIEFVIVFVGLMLTRGCKSVSYKRRGRGQSSCVPTSSAFLNVVHCTLLSSSFLKLRQCVRLRLPVTSPHLSLSWQKLTG